MEDQAAQNARVERWRAWAEFTEVEKAGAIVEMVKHLRHPRWTQEAGALAGLWAIRVGLERKEHLLSPIRWEELSREQWAARLVEVADWCREQNREPMERLRSACLDVAEDLQRRRQVPREGRER
jgi:hypothetical protein